MDILRAERGSAAALLQRDGSFPFRPSERQTVNTLIAKRFDLLLGFLKASFDHTIISVKSVGPSTGGHLKS